MPILGDRQNVESRGKSHLPADSQLGRILITEVELQRRVDELGHEIARRYRGEPVLLLGVLKGAVLFLSDLVRAIAAPVSFDFISISRYERGSKSSGEVQIMKDLETQIEGKNVILVEDIVDTGLTLNYLLNTLERRNPARLEVCALLDRPHLRLVPRTLQYVGFQIPNDFVVGYGLDFQEAYRNLPYICFLEPPQARPNSAEAPNSTAT